MTDTTTNERRDPRKFRAALLMLGMGQRELAERAGVDERSVHRWVNPEYKWNVPDGVWDEYIQPELERQEEMVEACIQIVEEQEKLHGEPDAVRLPWYLSADELPEGDTRTVDMANADTRRAWAALSALGYSVEIVAPHETGVRRALG